MGGERCGGEDGWMYQEVIITRPSHLRVGRVVVERNAKLRRDRDRIENTVLLRSWLVGCRIGIEVVRCVDAYSVGTRRW